MIVQEANGGSRCDFPLETTPLPLYWFWSWTGKCFGYRVNDALFTFGGIQAGRFHRSKIFGGDGRYLGEIHSGNRLITDLGCAPLLHDGFETAVARAYPRQQDLQPFHLAPGFADFPSSRLFR